MSLSTTRLQRQLQALESRREAVLRRLLGKGELAIGTVSVIDRKCGRTGCHCAEGDGHPQVQFLFADPKGQRRCKLVRKADEERLLEANQRYREFRKDLRELVAIQKREQAILMAMLRARGLRYE